MIHVGDEWTFDDGDSVVQFHTDDVGRDLGRRRRVYVNGRSTHAAKFAEYLLELVPAQGTLSFRIEECDHGSFTPGEEMPPVRRSTIWTATRRRLFA